MYVHTLTDEIADQIGHFCDAQLRKSIMKISHAYLFWQLETSAIFVPSFSISVPI